MRHIWICKAALSTGLYLPLFSHRSVNQAVNSATNNQKADWRL